jgi:hypothetical protein
MSRFTDILQQASPAAAPPMGFRAARVAARPRLLLVASLSQVGSEAELAGADAGILPISGASTKAGIKEKAPASPDIPWGGWLDSISRGGVKRLEEAGYDFVFFPADKMSLAILEADNVGRILAIEPMLDAGLLRTINELPVDAVFASSQQQGNPVTWHQLMLFRRLAALLAKSLLVPVPPAVASGDLQALWEAGVDGVVVELTPGGPAGRLKKLRQQIESLTPPQKQSPTKARALLPGITPETSPAAEEEEDEEE